MLGHDGPATIGEIDEKPGSVEESSLDLVGGPFAVIESDPGVFSSLTGGLGVKRAEVVEIYDIEPWAVDHLNPYGLIFCFTWHKDVHRPTDFNDPAAERVWFANQLSDDACATHAILNVLFNCPGLELGKELGDFRRETEQLSPVMRGLAITNSPLLRQAHNSLARPPDIRAALNVTAINTLTPKRPRPPQTKGKLGRTSGSRRATKSNKSARRSKKTDDDDDEVDDENPTYHFIGYVPAFGKVWELDGLKSGPLEVGELASETTTEGWMDVVRPALRMKMAKYGGSGSEDSNIRFSLLAIVQDMHLKGIDDLEFFKRDKQSLENRMTPGWEAKVEPTLSQASANAFDYIIPEDYHLPVGFAKRRMERDIEIMEMPEEKLVSAWNTVVQDAARAKVSLEDEIMKRIQCHTDHVKRTFDYEPLFKEFVTRLYNEGLLYPLLNLDDDKKVAVPSPKKKRT